MTTHDWYEIKKVNPHLYVIRERLDHIEPRYLTRYTNMYLIIGQEKALLIDTGAGVFPLRSLVQKLNKSKDLIIVNTHSDFDHIGNNQEFQEVFIHRNEVEEISRPKDISFLKNSAKNIVNRYKSTNFKIKSAAKINPIRDRQKFDLGGIQLTCLHTPGHSPGSISLFTNKNELFTGDLAHYGAVYVPKREKLVEVRQSFDKLLLLYEKNPNIKIFPSHERFGVSKRLIFKY
ncbi:MAG: MBL fold metallo-hydrolase [Promethearchaeia archaeon]